MSPKGTGTVGVLVALSRSAAAEVTDLRVGLPIADLQAAGWVVQGPHRGTDGATVLSATHAFSSVAQISGLVADIAGRGTAASRPFRLAISEAKGLLQDRWKATGAVDLRCSLACFDDARLSQTVGYPLGLPPAELSAALGANPRAALSFSMVVALPGRSGSAQAGRAGNAATVRIQPRSGAPDGATVFDWHPALGQEAAITASTEAVDLPLLRQILVAVSAGALIVLASAALVVVRAKRRRRRVA